MATKTVQDSSLTAIADAIRAKTGKSASMEFPTEFVSEIASISGGGGGDTVVEGKFTGNGTNTISIVVSKVPDIIYISRKDIDSIVAVSDRAHALFLRYETFINCSMYTAASATSLQNSGVLYKSAIGGTSNPTFNQVSYTNGTMYIKSGNNSNLWSSSLEYNYTFVYHPSSGGE